TWLLYANYAAEGYTKTRTIPIGDYGCTKDQTYWTHKGRRFLYEFLKNDGILPLIEQIPAPA
ncbi:MAG: phage antirepressor KilAC domain-containing protein, partial [Oscillospiraceae bacterium]|nr:phage antirepressor KilAC domain-containing protein [Oscillospiraceae bacterium]